MKKTALLLFAILLFVLASCGGEETPAKDYLFRSGDVSIAVNAEAEPILSALGAYTAYDESPSCAFEGLDKIYTYHGFEIQTYPMNGKDYIYAIYLTDDSVSTPEGIAVGATAAEVCSAYGDAAVTGASSITCSGKDMKLEFLLRNNLVTNIQYIRTGK